MGTRAQVLIKDTGVYLYRHSDGNLLINDVKRAIARGERWNSPEYLARIIFSEMIRDSIDSDLGYGIGTEMHGDLGVRLIVVDCEKQVVEYGGILFPFQNLIDKS